MLEFERRIKTHTYTRTIPPSQRDSSFFAPESISVLPCSPTCPPHVFVPSLSTWRGLSVLKFPQVKWQLTSRPLWCFKKLLSHRRPPSVSHFALSCPFCELFILSFFYPFFLFLSSFLFSAWQTLKGFFIDKRCSIIQQISSFVCLWLCPESVLRRLGAQRGAFLKPSAETPSHTFHKHLAGRWERQFIKSVIRYFFSKGLW